MRVRRGEPHLRPQVRLPPPQRQAPADGEHDQLARACDRMLCNCNRECECMLQAQYDATPDSNG